MDKCKIIEDDKGFLKYIGAEVVDCDNGSAELAFAIKPHHKQHMGVVHGGAIATLADHTGWYAVISLLDDGYTSATIELKTNFLKPANGDVLKAVAKVVNKTKRTVFATIEVFAKDTLVAYATGTYAIIDESKLIKQKES